MFLAFEDELMDVRIGPADSPLHDPMELAESNVPSTQHTSPNRRMGIKQDYFDLIGFHWSVKPRCGCKIGEFESRKKTGYQRPELG